MNVPFAAAGVLALAGAVWHGVGGELGIVGALDPTRLAPSFFGDGEVTKRFLRAAWHLFTLHLLALAAVFFWLAPGPPSEAGLVVGRGVALELASFLALYVVLAARRPALFLRAPQWLFFAALGALAWVGGG